MTKIENGVMIYEDKDICMEARKNGFIDLEKVFANPKCKLIPWKMNETNIEEYGHSKIKYIFKYNDEIWLYKYNGFRYAYMELIAEELAQLFSIPTAHYDLAMINQEKGVITKNFKLNGVKYIKGIVIIENYLKNVLNIQDPRKLKEEIKKYNSLEGIRKSLDYWYRNNAKRDELVSKLMEQLTNVFIYDILTGQTDRHEYHWGISETNNDIFLQPLFDNERILYFENNFRFYVHTEMEINNYLEETGNFSESLKRILLEFLIFSEEKYLNIIQEKIHLIEKINIKNIFYKIEKRTFAPIPEEIKEKNLEDFQILRRIIMETIKEYQKSNKKGIILNYFQSLKKILYNMKEYQEDRKK